MTTAKTRKTKRGISAADNSRDRLLEAREKAVSARETAMEAVGRVSEGRSAMNKLEETLTEILDEAEQFIQKHNVHEQEIIPQPNGGSFPDEPFDIYPEIKRKTVSAEAGRSRQLEQLIHDLIEEKARKKIEQVEEEARIYKIKAQQAFEEAETVKKAAQTAIARVRREALELAEKEIARARKEIGLARYAAEDAVRQAQEETNRYKEEAETANCDARLAISLAQEKIKTLTEEMRAIQQQALADANKARAEILKAKEEAETARRQSRKAISRAEAESRSIQQEAEDSITRVNEILLRAGRHVAGMTPE